MSYTKHKVIRVKDLTPDIFELVITKNNLIFSPGDTLILNSSNGPNMKKEYFIASGIQEPWIRLLIRKSDSDWVTQLYNLKQNDMVRAEYIPNKYFPNMIKENPRDLIYICSDIGIGPLYSYLSSLRAIPDIKIKKVLYYSGKNNMELVNRPWLEADQDVLYFPDIDSLVSKAKGIKTGDSPLYYICGSEELSGVEKAIWHIKSPNIKSVIY